MRTYVSRNYINDYYSDYPGQKIGYSADKTTELFYEYGILNGDEKVTRDFFQSDLEYLKEKDETLYQTILSMQQLILRAEFEATRAGYSLKQRDYNFRGSYNVIDSRLEKIENAQPDFDFKVSNLEERIKSLEEDKLGKFFRLLGVFSFVCFSWKIVQSIVRFVRSLIFPAK